MADFTVINNGGSSLAVSSVAVYAFDTLSASQSHEVASTYNPLAKMPLMVQGCEIIPYGERNNYPDLIDEVLERNHLAPAIIQAHINLLWGSGPMLYRNVILNGRRYKQWCEDSIIQKWLDSWDYKSYLLNACKEFHTFNGHFTKFLCRQSGADQAGRPGSMPVISLENTQAKFARLEWPDDFGEIGNIIVSDTWGTDPYSMSLTRYPVFDHYFPTRHKRAMAYSCLQGFALDQQYPRSPIHGSLTWINLSSGIPRILASSGMNAAAIKYHIQVPSIYWNQKAEQLQKQCVEKGIAYHDRMLEDLKTETFAKVSAALSGIKNVGKMITTEEFFDATAGRYVGWKIDVLDQKVKDFIDAELKIASEADFAITAGMGMHPQLSNLHRDVGLSTGSEAEYAHKIYQNVSVDIPEKILTREINRALQLNFPASELCIGFIHT